MGGTGIVDGQLTIRTMADDAAGLMKRLNIASAHVFGFSMGGYIAQELAAHYPQMVQRLVLGCTNCGPARSIPQTPDEIDRLGKVMAASPNDQVRGFCMAMVAEDFAARAPQFMEDMVTAHRSTQMGVQPSDGRDQRVRFLR
jgi:pimeloyl-ACP methyl ester carboxylesterase